MLKKSRFLAAMAAAAILCSAFSFAGAAPAKMTELKADSLVPVGRAAGIKLFAEGAVVISFSDSGGQCPARSAGLKPGDVIVSVGGYAVFGSEDLTSALAKNGVKPVRLTVLRGEKTLSVEVTPLCDAEGNVRIGAWVRDSLAGVGTITFYDPQSGVVGLLGHGIADGETGSLMPLGAGSLVPATVTGVKKSRPGAPGELIADFGSAADAGRLISNSDTGLFGTLGADELYPELLAGKPIPIATQNQIIEGKATILANVNGDEVCEYDIEITKIINYDRSTKNLQIRITDPVLLSLTGGIVQGMSGSPIIQNGRIVGAVTHVLVDSPSEGYGIYIGNMLKFAQKSAAVYKAA